LAETVVEINTENGTSTEQTNILRGFLEAIIIDSESKVEVVIESERGYTLLHKHDCFGTIYVPLRVQPIDKKGWGANFQLDKYHLNERLIISVFGPQNKQVIFTIKTI